jgi:Ca2+-binding EF-hand superfamily protein
LKHREGARKPPVIQSPVQRAFDSLDGNGDGEIDKSEWARAYGVAGFENASSI